MERDGLIQKIKENNRSGATELTREAARVLSLEVYSRFHSSVEDFRKELLATARVLVSAQPAMASIFNLVNACLLGARPARPGMPGNLSDIKEAAAQALNDFMAVLKENALQVRVQGAALVEEGYTILTHSASEAVASTFTTAHDQGKDFTVICTESRPIFEGRGMAERLAAHGIKVKLLADAAAFQFLAETQLVLVGADAVGSFGVVNKIGTRGLALAAKEAGVPFYVVATTEKVLPAEAPPPLKEEPKDPGELWERPAPGLEVINLYFDITPLNYVTALITEKGKVKPDQLAVMAASLEIFPELI